MASKKPQTGEGHVSYYDRVRAKGKALRERIASGKMSPKDGNA